jgi:hypothetical protein
MKSARWIIIGTVQRAYVRLGNCGFPNGWRIDWRGRVDWCQPSEFIRGADPASAVRTRLRIAGLKLLETSYTIVERRWLLHCRVERLHVKEPRSRTGIQT